MKYVDWDVLNKKLLIRSVHGEALVVKVNYDDTFASDDGKIYVRVLYLVTSEWEDLNFTEEDSQTLDAQVYGGYWQLEYINSLLGVNHELKN